MGPGVDELAVGQGEPCVQSAEHGPGSGVGELQGSGDDVGVEHGLDVGPAVGEQPLVGSLELLRHRAQHRRRAGPQLRRERGELLAAGQPVQTGADLRGWCGGEDVELVADARASGPRCRGQPLRVAVTATEERRDVGELEGVGTERGPGTADEGQRVRDPVRGFERQ